MGIGSRAKFTAHRGSDLDLAIDAGRPLTTTESIELADAFDESNLPYTVDVVDLRSITPRFRAIIEQQPMIALTMDAGPGRVGNQTLFSSPAES